LHKRQIIHQAPGAPKGTISEAKLERGDYVKPFGTIAFVLLLVVAPSIAAQTVDQVPLDFRELFNTLRYPGLTALEQQALIGKRYSGDMWIRSVERDKKGTVRLNCRVTVNNAEHDLLYAGIASFEMNDAEKAASLKSGYKVRLTGRLARIYTDDVRGRTEFVDVTLDAVFFPSRS
jgi:hypothetical protein